MNSRSYVLLAATATLGCHAWTAVTKPSADGSLPGNPRSVRVTRSVGCGDKPATDCVAKQTTLVLHSPRVAADSLIGYYDEANRKRVAIHVREVISIESRSVDPYRTTGVILGVGALLAIGAVIGLVVLTSNTAY
ncbi:MAG: hypothetical protein ACJ791_00195 [Gemmatimonadaceae bacterium]